MTENAIFSNRTHCYYSIKEIDCALGLATHPSVINASSVLSRVDYGMAHPLEAGYNSMIEWKINGVEFMQFIQWKEMNPYTESVQSRENVNMLQSHFLFFYVLFSMHTLLVEWNLALYLCSVFYSATAPFAYDERIMNQSPPLFTNSSRAAVLLTLELGNLFSFVDGPFLSRSHNWKQSF